VAKVDTLAGHNRSSLLSYAPYIGVRPPNTTPCTDAKPTCQFARKPLFHALTIAFSLRNTPGNRTLLKFITPS